MVEEIIDLDKEFLALFKKEEIFAFFDFSLTLPGERTVAGLCKISRPRSAESKSYYISVLFMIDADDDTVGHEVDEYLNSINWDDLKGAVPEIASVLPMPYLSQRSGIYIREIDFYLTADKLTRDFFSRFHPLLAGVTGFRAEAPIFWDDIHQDGKPVAVSEPPTAKRAAWYKDMLKKMSG